MYCFIDDFWRLSRPQALHRRPLSEADLLPTAYSLAGLGLGYGVSPSVRAISNWATGLGPYTVLPGNQFTVGVALRYQAGLAPRCIRNQLFCPCSPFS